MNQHVKIKSLECILRLARLQDPILDIFETICLHQVLFFIRLKSKNVCAYQDCIRFVPAVPKDPKPHKTTDKLGLKFLFLRYLRILPVLWLNVRTSASPRTIKIFKINIELMLIKIWNVYNNTA